MLDDPVTAFRQIDRTLAAARRDRRPVYIEIPRDMVTAEGFALPAAIESGAEPASDEAALTEAVAEAVELLDAAASPVVIAGVEVHRRSLQDALVDLIERGRLPIAATLTGKSVIGERHPYYIGVYEGAMS